MGAPKEPRRIMDPDELFQTHERQLQELYKENEELQIHIDDRQARRQQVEVMIEAHRAFLKTLENHVSVPQQPMPATDTSSRY